MSHLPQLRESLMVPAEKRARREMRERQAGERVNQGGPAGRWRGARRRQRGLQPALARRGSLVLIVMVCLLTAAVAYATTQLIQTGSPVRSEESFSPNAGAGVAITKTEGLLGIAASDPAGGPPWTMRVYDTSRGLGCAQVGRLVGGRIGVLGQDGAFGNDGRFHALPLQASQAEGDCVLLDGAGHAFLGVGTYDEPASGLPRECHLLGSRDASERCARSDPRDVFYGLLGPEARSITYEDQSHHTHTIPTVGSEGAYLIVERASAKLTSRGVEVGSSLGVEIVGSGSLPAGGGTLNGIRLRQPIRKISYTGGRMCTITRRGYRDNHGGHCLPPVGYVTQRPHIPSARELAAPIGVRTLFGQPLTGHPGASQVELLISFTAHVAVSSALTGYNVVLEAPESGSCRRPRLEQADAAIGRNVKSGEIVQLRLFSGYADSQSLFPGCPGLARGRVTYSVPSSEQSSGGSYGPFARRHSHVVTVGRFTYLNP
jgi:hypothetical protein